MKIVLGAMLIVVPLGLVLLVSMQKPGVDQTEGALLEGISTPGANSASSDQAATPPPLTLAEMEQIAEEMSAARGAREDSLAQDESGSTPASKSERVRTTDERSPGSSSLERIDQAIDNLEYLAMAAYLPVIEQLNESALTRRQWIDRLKTSEEHANHPATAQILSRLDNQEVISFLQDAVAMGDPDLLRLSIDTLTHMYDVNPVEAGIVDDPVALLPDPGDTYSYASALNILTDGGIDYSEQVASRLASALTEGLYDNNHVTRFAALEAQFDLNAMPASDLEEAAINELTHRDPQVRSKALANLEYWMESGYQPSAYAKNRLLNQIVSDYELMDDRYAGNVAYLVSSELTLTTEQKARLKASGVSVQDGS